MTAKWAFKPEEAHISSVSIKPEENNDLKVDVSFTLKKKHAFLTGFGLVLVLLIGFTIGYNTSDPATFGHTWGEMTCVDCIITENVGLGALDKTDISSNGVWNKNEIPGNLNTTTNFVDGSDNTLMTIQNTGKVGIGITNPGTKLDVVETGYTGTRYSGGDGASTFTVVARSGTNRQINFDVGGATTGWGGVINQINSAVASGSQQYGLWNTNDFSNTTNLMTQINTDGSGQIELRKFGTGLISNLNFINNGNTAITIDSAGKAGIGTTSPGAVLDVAGDLRVVKNVSGDTTVHGMLRNTNAAGRAQFIVDSSPNFPSTPYNFFALMTHGTTYASDNYLTDATSDAGLGILLGQGTNMTKFAVGTYNSIPLSFFTNNIERLYITSTGNVGIGTPNLGSKLDVKSSDTSINPVGITGYNATTNTGGVSTSYGGLSVSNGVDSTLAIRMLGSGHAQITTDAATRYISFATGAFQERMRIDSAGKVGIGTPSPNKKLVVDSSGDTIAGWFKSSGATELYVGSAEQAGDIVSIRSDPTNNYGNIRIWGDTEANGITIKSGGKVGIGTTSPNYKLEVSGTLGFTGGTGPFCIFATACPTGWVSKGLGGYISNTGAGATCPYSLGGAYNPTWYWCHPTICCTS